MLNVLVIGLSAATHLVTFGSWGPMGGVIHGSGSGVIHGSWDPRFVGEGAVLLWYMAVPGWYTAPPLSLAAAGSCPLNPPRSVRAPNKGISSEISTRLKWKSQRWVDISEPDHLHPGNLTTPNLLDTLGLEMEKRMVILDIPKFIWLYIVYYWIILDTIGYSVCKDEDGNADHW